MQLKIGTALTLEPTYTDRVEEFHCKVVEQEGNILFIDYPKNSTTKKTAFLVDGAQFRATFITESKVRYAFNTEVLGRKKGNIPTIMLSVPPGEEFVKIQRREFVRVRTAVDVSVEFKNIYYQFMTEDISAGGIALVLNSDVPFKDGDPIHLTIVLPYSNGDIRYIQTDANVIRIFEKDNRRFASIQFTEMADIDKQYMVRFCFERQLMIRRKNDAYMI